MLLHLMVDLLFDIIFSAQQVRGSNCLGIKGKITTENGFLELFSFLQSFRLFLNGKY